MSDAVVARWDGFLNQIQQRFTGIMNEAREGCAMLTKQPDFNPIVMGNAWTGIEHRVRELRTKVDDTWREAVEPKFEEAGASNDIITRERFKTEQMAEWLEVETDRTRIAIYCDATRAMMEEGRKAVAKGSQCTQCGAALTVPFGFRALNIPCNHCRTVNTYEPGSNIRLVEAMGLHPLCEEAAWQAKLAMREAEKALRKARPETINDLRRFEHAQLNYWHTYLTFRVHLLPELQPSFDKDLRGKMAHWYQAMETNAVWASAGRVRALP